MTVYRDLADVPSGRYSVIYADPPWSYTCTMSAYETRASSYQTMPTEAIAAMDVGRIAASDAWLLVWVTWPQLFHARAVIDGWGFEYSTDGWVWVKTTQAHVRRPRKGMGHFTRTGTEFTLAAKRGRPPVLDHNVDDVIYSTAAQHSRKPRVCYGLIERLCGPGPKIELFCRGPPAAGWDAMGWEADGRATTIDAHLGREGGGE